MRQCLFILMLAIPCVAPADIVGAVNDVRLHGCDGSAGAGTPLRPNARLDEAARRLSHGADLDEATEKSGYRAVVTASVRITNVPDDRDVARIVGQRFCGQVTNRALREMGTHRHGPDVWLVVAAPFTPPKPSEHHEIARRVLELTNAARARAQRCGSAYFPPAAPLTLAPLLERPALEHSQDMAAHDELNHLGHDGSTPADRITRAGYKWRVVGENLASGVMNPEEAVQGWLGSPHHCENLMSPRFTQMAVAYAVNSSSHGGIFWTQLFGTPR